MNPQEKEAAQKISRIFKCARLESGIGQSELAQTLGAAQSTISKIESGALLPSSLMWLQLCNELNIDPGSLFVGYLDKKTSVQHRSSALENGFRLPKKYSSDRYTKIRELNPVFRFAENKFGTSKLHSLIETLEVDPFFIYNHDNQINFNFYLDFISLLIKKGKLSKNDIIELSHYAGTEEIQGALYANYKNLKDADKKLLSFVSNQSKYQENFSYEVISHKNNYINLSIKPEQHVLKSNYLEHEFSKDIFCTHKKEYLKNFALYETKHAEIIITEKECLHKGANQCLYHMTIN